MIKFVYAIEIPVKIWEVFNKDGFETNLEEFTNAISAFNDLNSTTIYGRTIYTEKEKILNFSEKFMDSLNRKQEEMLNKTNFMEDIEKILKKWLEVYKVKLDDPKWDLMSVEKKEEELSKISLSEKLDFNWYIVSVD